MPPHNSNPRIQPSLNFKYPTNRDLHFKSASQWLQGKKVDDDVGNLWRVHDSMYNLSTFISSHPGGPSWLEISRGTDITEAFEAHHLTSMPEEMLKRYFVRKAAKPRNSPFTFKEDGFYRTLKRNVKIALKDIPRSTSNVSNLIADLLCVTTFIFAILACKFNSVILAILSGFCLTFTTIAAHNYFHKRDNFRMYYFNLCLMDFREWRISHALSHHMFPNTIIDFEVSMLEPFIQYLPHQKSSITKYRSYVFTFVLWVLMYFSSYAKRLIEAYHKQTRLDVIDAIPFSIPLAMYIFSGVTMYKVLIMWILIISFGSFVFGAIGFNAAHHHPDTFHEGDAPRSKTDIDWGIHQLDAVADRHDINGNMFLALTNFGDHALHHLFPTLDQAVLRCLYPTFEKTMEEFDISLDMRSQIEMVVGQFKQLTRDVPNVVPRGHKLRNSY